jgi:hypothetical protein
MNKHVCVCVCVCVCEMTKDMAVSIFIYLFMKQNPLLPTVVTNSGFIIQL